jgi:hypothetical protein
MTDKPVNKSNVECFRYHKYRHNKYECQTNLNSDGNRKFNFVDKKDETFLLMTCHMNEKNHQVLWYLNTGCSNYMSRDKPVLFDLDESY